MRGSVERQSEQLFSSAGSRLFSSVASRSPSVERKFPFSRLDSLDLSDAAPLHIKCLVISNLHSTGGGFSAWAAERVAHGQQPAIPSLFPATGRLVFARRPSTGMPRWASKLSCASPYSPLDVKHPPSLGRGQCRSGRKQPNLLMVSCMA